MLNGHTDRKRFVDPVEEEGWQLTLPLDGAVAVLALHGQLPSFAWAFSQAFPGARLGYVQTSAGQLAGAPSAEVRALLARDLLAGQLAASAASADEREALTIAGALYHGLRALGWDAAVCGPGPDVADSAAHAANDGLPPAHGGLAALDTAHIALALGSSALLVPRMSSAAIGTRRRGISPETLAVLDLLLQPVTVALPAGLRSPVGADLRAGLGAVFGAPRGAPVQLELDVARPARIARHDWRRAPIDLPGFAAAGLPAEAAGRRPAEDPLFFGATLAAGATLAELVREQRAHGPAGRADRAGYSDLADHPEEGEGAAA
jgi:Protein of unknown function (DUF3866)